MVHVWFSKPTYNDTLPQIVSISIQTIVFVQHFAHIFNKDASLKCILFKANQYWYEIDAIFGRINLIVFTIIYSLFTQF